MAVGYLSDQCLQHDQQYDDAGMPETLARQYPCGIAKRLVLRTAHFHPALFLRHYGCGDVPECERYPRTSAHHSNYDLQFQRIQFRNQIDSQFRNQIDSQITIKLRIGK